MTKFLKLNDGSLFNLLQVNLIKCDYMQDNLEFVINRDCTKTIHFAEEYVIEGNDSQQVYRLPNFQLKHAFHVIEKFLQDKEAVILEEVELRKHPEPDNIRIRKIEKQK